jgi:hypothetical protein
MASRAAPHAATLIGLSVALVLGGCVSVSKIDPFASGAVDPTSAVAEQVRQAPNTPGGYPRFKDVPPAPTDLRTPGDWRAAVTDTWRIKLATETTAQRIPFSLSDSEDWAKTRRAMIPADQTAPAPSDSAAQSDAYAQALRERATPPPPLN